LDYPFASLKNFVRIFMYHNVHEVQCSVNITIVIKYQW